MGTSRYNGQHEHDEEQHLTEPTGQMEAPSSLFPTVLHRLGLDRQQELPPLEALAGALRHPQWYVRAEALRMLSKLSQQGHNVPPELLLPTLRDPHATVRVAAIHALSLQGHNVPTQALFQVLQDDEWIVREAVVLALERLGEPIPSMLLHDADATVRDAASLALHQRSCPPSTSPALPVSSVPEARPVGQLRREEVAPRSLLHNIFYALLPSGKSARYTGAVMRETEYESGEYSPTLRSHGQQSQPSRRRRVQHVLTASILVAVLAVSILGWAFVAQHLRPASSPGTTTTLGRPTATPIPTSTQSSGSVGKTLYTYQCKGDKISTIAWSKDSTRIANNCIQLQSWDATTGNHVVRYGNEISASTILSANWSPDSKRIQVSDYTGTVQVYDSTTTKLLVTYRPASTTGRVTPSSSAGAGPLASYVPLSGGANLIFDSSWSPNGQLIASAVSGLQYGYNVQVWDLQTGQYMYTLQGNIIGNNNDSDFITEVRWSPDGKYIAFTQDKAVEVWSVATKQLVTTHPSFTSFFNTTTFAWSPDSMLIASISQDGKAVEVWNATTNQAVYTYRGQSGESNALGSLAWSPNGKRIASGGSDIHVWDATSGSHVYAYTNDGASEHGTISPIAWSPDGSMIASTSTSTVTFPPRNITISLIRVWIAA